MAWQQLLEMTQPPLADPANLAAWYAGLLAQRGVDRPLDLAILGGYQAPTPGLAFLAGYQAALRALWPAAPDSLGAFCVTEQRSLRPADMQSRLTGSGVNGSKDFVTGGDAANWLLVSARVENPGEDARLAVLLVESAASGVAIESGAPLSMLPDVPHGRLRLSDAQGLRLPGDGWERYVKPFRTLEDLHVLAAIGAWAYGVGCEQGWPLDLRLRLLGLLTGCAGLDPQQLHGASGHLLLAGLFCTFNALRGELDQAFAAGPEPLAQSWQRDQRVLDLARAAREKRLQKALLSLGLGA